MDYETVDEAYDAGMVTGYEEGYGDGLEEAERGYEDGLEEGYSTCLADMRAIRRTTLVPMLEELFRVTEMMKDRPPTFEEIADAVSEELSRGY